MPDLSTNDLVQRTRDLLGDTPTVITSTTTTTATSITVSDPTFLSEGDVLEWQTGTVGYEQMRVTNANGGANPITVVRGFNGTTAETHTSGDSLFVNPAFTGRQTQQALQAGLRKLWPYAYIVTALDIGAPVTGQVWYDITAAPATTMGIVYVRQKWGTSPTLYQGDYRRPDQKGGLPVLWDLSADTTIAATGFAVRFPAGTYHVSNHIFVATASPLTGATDIPDTGKFPVADCLSYFAAGRMTGALEIPRVASGGDLEASSTVGTGARTSTGFVFVQQFQDLLQSIGIRYRNFYHPLEVQ